MNAARCHGLGQGIGDIAGFGTVGQQGLFQAVFVDTRDDHVKMHRGIDQQLGPDLRT